MDYTLNISMRWLSCAPIFWELCSQNVFPFYKWETEVEGDQVNLLREHTWTLKGSVDLVRRFLNHRVIFPDWTETRGGRQTVSFWTVRKNKFTDVFCLLACSGSGLIKPWLNAVHFKSWSDIALYVQGGALQVRGHLLGVLCFAPRFTAGTSEFRDSCKAPEKAKLYIAFWER